MALHAVPTIPSVVAYNHPLLRPPQIQWHLNLKQKLIQTIMVYQLLRIVLQHQTLECPHQHPAPEVGPPEDGIPPPVSIPNGNRAWNDMDDQQLVEYKQDSRSRPSWKTIGQRLRRTPESCRARWMFLKNTQTWFQMTLLLRSNLLILSLLENFPCCLLLLWGFYLSLLLLHPVSSLHFSISFGSWLLRFRFQAMDCSRSRDLAFRCSRDL